ncbi:MAG TPA: Trp family transcriptional regulator [bacterium]|nr:Trp family transcriptional regulator [bacterium]
MREIARVLAELDDEELITAFLRDILTPKERHDISARWELVKRLFLGDSQRKIAADLGLSLCKITRGSRELKKERSAFRAIIARYLNRPKGPAEGDERR